MMHLAQWTGGPTQPAQIKDIEFIVGRVIEISLSAGGILLLIYLMLGGYSLLSSGGDPGKVAAAWKTITYAILGIILLAAGYLILQVVSYFTGFNVTLFSITYP